MTALMERVFFWATGSNLEAHEDFLLSLALLLAMILILVLTGEET